MSIRRALLSFSFGLFFAVLAVGLLPFLVLFSWAEIIGFTESHMSPLFLLVKKLYKDDDF